MISVFLGGTSFFNTFSLECAKENIKDKFWPTFKIGACFWPCVNFVSYQFLSRHMHASVNDLFAFFYGVIISYVNNNYKT